MKNVQVLFCVLTALLGGPFFLLLLHRGQRE